MVGSVCYFGPKYWRPNHCNLYYNCNEISDLMWQSDYFVMLIHFYYCHGICNKIYYNLINVTIIYIYKQESYPFMLLCRSDFNRPKVKVLNSAF